MKQAYVMLFLRIHSIGKIDLIRRSFESVHQRSKRDTRYTGGERTRVGDATSDPVSRFDKKNTRYRQVRRHN